MFNKNLLAAAWSKNKSKTALLIELWWLLWPIKYNELIRKFFKKYWDYLRYAANWKLSSEESFGHKEIHMVINNSQGICLHQLLLHQLNVTAQMKTHQDILLVYHCPALVSLCYSISLQFLAHRIMVFFCCCSSSQNLLCIKEWHSANLQYPSYP